MKNIIVVGAGPFALEVVQYLSDWLSVGNHARQHKIKGFLHVMDKASVGFTTSYEILGHTSDYLVEKNDVFVVALGQPGMREEYSALIARKGGTFHTIVHPLAYVAPSAQVSPGCVICPFTFVGPSAILHEQVVLNVYACVGHEAIIGKHSVLSPYAGVMGGAALSERVFMGAGAIVIPSKTVGSNSKLAAGSMIMTNIPENCLAVGNPAKWRVLYR